MPCAPAQVAIAGPTEGAVDVAQVFTATVSPVCAALPITYTWQATGHDLVTHAGVPSLSDVASFSWATAGSQTVAVTATNALGWATGSYTFTAYVPPQAAFSAAPTSGPPPLTVVFTNTTTGEYTASLWDFGDEITSTLQSPTHTYTVAGAYTVTLSVEGPYAGDQEVKADLIHAYVPVEAGFAAAPLAGLAPLTVVFTNTSAGDYTSSLWGFGDGITSTLPSPTHTYAVPGVYTVTLTAQGPGGSDTAVMPELVDVWPNPGPPETDLVLQDLGASAAAVNLAYTAAEAGGLTRRHDLGQRLAPHGWRHLAAEELAPGVSGEWAGSALVLATQPLAVLVEAQWGEDAAAAYAGEAPAGTAACVPALAIGRARVSRFTVHNAEPTEATVVLRFYDRAGVERLVQPATIPPSAEGSFSLADLRPDFAATEGWGSALVTSTGQVAVVASLHWADGSEAYRAPAAGSAALWLAGMARRQVAGGWDHGEALIQNPGAVTATVHVEFRNPDGSLAHALDDAIPPHGAAAYSTREPGTLDPPPSPLAGGMRGGWQALIAALGDQWTGSVHVASTNGRPLVGVALGSRAALTDTLAYQAAPASAPGQALAFPAVYRKLTGGAGETWSRAYVQNGAAVSGTLTVEFYNADGVRVGEAYTVAVPAHGAACLDLKEGADLPPAALAALGSDWSGAMVVTPSAGLEIMGVSQTFWPGEGRAAGYEGLPLP